MTTELVGYFVRRTLSGESTTDLTYQFGYGDKWMLMFVGWRQVGSGPREITTLRCNLMEQSLQELNAFSFKRAGLSHYLVFLAALGALAVTAIALVKCVRAKWPRRKWVWVICILAGFTRTSLDWTTGEWSFHPISVQLFSAGFMAAGPFAAWIVSVSVPVGAIWFWVRDNREKRRLPPPVPGSA